MDTAELIDLKDEADIEQMESTLDENTPFEFREGFPKEGDESPVVKVTTVTVTIRSVTACGQGSTQWEFRWGRNGNCTGTGEQYTLGSTRSHVARLPV